jgi:hypothetical protein
MKPGAILFCLGVLVTTMDLQAQRFPTNSIDAVQAGKIASHLRAGMREQDVARILDEQNGLKCGGDVGGSIGWTRFYLLADGCFLDLQMEPKEVRNHGRWGGDGLLRSASIQSNGVKIVSITLINALQPSGQANGSQPIRSETNSTSSAAGSRRWPFR